MSPRQSESRVAPELCPGHSGRYREASLNMIDVPAECRNLGNLCLIVTRFAMTACCLSVVHERYRHVGDIELNVLGCDVWTQPGGEGFKPVRLR